MKRNLVMITALLLCAVTMYAQPNKWASKADNNGEVRAGAVRISVNGKGSQNKPNIIFILADDVGYSVPGVNGGQSYATPNIDSVARHGMRFTHCEASPMCSPSRYLFLTGKYNFRNYSNWAYMSDTAKTIANVMHNAGYATGIFGKLQLQYNDTTMHNWGWDYNIVFELTEDTMKGRRYKNPVLRENGYRIPDSVTANKYCDDILTQKIFDFIDSNNNSKPFFVYYSMSLGHYPYSPTPDDSAFATWDPNQDKSDTSFFPSMMHYMDKKVGQIIDWLHAKNLDTNTIVLFAGDNGTPNEIYYNADGINHIRGEKSLSTEGGTHVPLIAYWPEHIQQGSLNDDLVSFEDFLPTFAEAAQVTNLSAYGILDGLSFYPALFQQQHTVKQQLFYHFCPHPGFNNLRRWVRDKTYKLYDSTTGVPQSGKFYNTVTDEAEQHPLKESSLTEQEKQIKQRFKNILDTIGTWPEAPTINNPFSDNITNNSARLTATIISSGPTMLIDRGSSLVRSGQQGTPFAYLNWNRMHDSIVALGTFSEVRKGLAPQTSYQYSLYAMNNNQSHSTGFASDSFYTLSNPPTLQPANFTASVKSDTIMLNWGNAQFPGAGAKNAGYLLVFSKDSIKILQYPNGKVPDSVVVSGQIIPTVSTVLPVKPAISTTVSGLLPGNYQFKLIPYTWNGSNAATYNYLTKNALSTTATIQGCIKSAFYRDADNDGYGDTTKQLLACVAPEGYVSNGSDCNDADANVHPDATEICNGIDDNCNGVIDEGCSNATISINDVFVLEGNSGQKKMSFTVSLSKTTPQAVKVNYATANGTALAGSDYIAQSGTLTFLAGTTKSSVNITILGDRQREANENFSVKLSNAVNANIADGTGKGTILNDDILTLRSPVTEADSRAADQFINNESLKLYPNPTTGRLTVEYYSDYSGNVEMSIYDLTGKKILYKKEVATKGMNKYEFNLTALAQGSYYLLLNKQSQQARIKFFIRR